MIAPEVFEIKVNNWIKSVKAINKELAKFNSNEKEAYQTILKTFEKKRANVKVISHNSEELKAFLADGKQDDFFTAVETFLKINELAVEEYSVFRDYLEDKEFLDYIQTLNPSNIQTPSPAASAGGSNFSAEYRREVIVDDDNDEVIYEGMYLGNDRVWKGKITWSDGSVYEGEWNNDGQHGYGRTTNADGRVDEGQYSNGDRTGKGKMVWPDGESYEGGWNDEGMHGQGICHYTDGRIDEGEYCDNCRTGIGKMIWPSGDWYEGGWNDEGMHGHGIYHCANGRVDEGEYCDHCRVGKGKIVWTNGNWYEGDWNDEGAHGFGTQYVTSVRRTDVGEFKNGNAMGNVTMKWNTGHKYVGTWSYDSNNNLNGKGTYYSDGKSESGAWIAGTWKKDTSVLKYVGVAAIVAGGLTLLGGHWIIGPLLILAGIGMMKS